MIIHPEFFFRESAIEGRSGAIFPVIIHSVVFDGFVVPFVFSKAKGGEKWGAGCDLSSDTENDPGSCVEVSDGEFSQQEIGHGIEDTKFVDSPLSPRGVIPLASMISINILGEILNFELG